MLNDKIKVFQSLFYWKSFCNVKQDFKVLNTELKFQSLFYWKSFCNETHFRHQTPETHCFNPCFIGNPSATDNKELIAITLIGVSILVLLEILLQQKKLMTKWSSQ